MTAMAATRPMSSQPGTTIVRTMSAASWKVSAATSQWENSSHTVKGRDGCRVPIPWDRSGPSFGFGDGKPWLPQPARYGELSAEAQTGVPGSTLEMYREAIRLRRELLTADESLEWVDSGDKHVLAFRRGSGVLCVVNFGSKPVALPAGRVLLASQPDIDGELPSDTTAWVVPG